MFCFRCSYAVFLVSPQLRLEFKKCLYIYHDGLYELELETSLEWPLKTQCIYKLAFMSCCILYSFVVCLSLSSCLVCCFYYRYFYCSCFSSYVGNYYVYCQLVFCFLHFILIYSYLFFFSLIAFLFQFTFWACKIYKL